MLDKIIKFVDKNDYLDFKEDVKSYAFKKIGDPSNDPDWFPWKNASEIEKKELEDSQNIVNVWLNAQFIELFFSKLVMDINRKLFWERYLKKITKFKICGSEYLYKELSLDKRVQPYLKSRFSYLSGNESALIMIMKNYILIEFSKKGNAFYGYEKSNIYCPVISKNSFRIEQLKYRYHADIRIVHTSDWQKAISNELIRRNII